MATEVKLPRLGQGMESGTIVKWLKSEGESVEKGDPLYELDTDKVTQEVEAEASGVLLKIAVAEGEVEVGKTIGFIGGEGESVSVDEPPKPEKKQDKAEEEKPAPAPTPEASTANGSSNGRIKASPLARRIARERGIELSQIRGTGPDGRIVAEDVERAESSAAAPALAAAAAPSGEVESRPLSSVRKTIARRLTQAWTVPAFQLTVNADMTRANELVAKQRELNPDIRITITDVLTKVCAQALMRHRDMNVQYADDVLLAFPNADVGIAVAAPHGLVVPVVHGAERLTIAQIAQVRSDLVGRARDGKLRSEDLEGGTFTISNLGMYDVDQFIAVLNPPQASILAVGATRDQVVPLDGDLHILPLMTMTLTCDHRAVDGATGAEFLRTIKAFLEDPRPRAVTPTVWYYVRDLDGARSFYRDALGFEETAVDFGERWSHLRHGDMEVGLAEGEPQPEGAVAHVDVPDLKAEADRLRARGIDVGIVFELQGEMRLLDVYDPDGNRVQLAQEL